MSKPIKSSSWCVPITDGYTVKCCDIFIDKDGESQKYCMVGADTIPPSDCTPREEVRDDSNNEDTSLSIPTNSGVGVEDDTNSGGNTSSRIPTKGDRLSSLDGDKVLSPPLRNRISNASLYFVSIIETRLWIPITISRAQIPHFAPFDFLTK